MRLLGETHIDFMKYRRFWILISLILIVVFFLAFFFVQPKLGIDFAGGTEITLRFRDKPQVDQLRSLLSAAGLADVEIQRYDQESANQIMVKTPVSKGTEEGSRLKVTTALSQHFNPDQAGRLDLNQAGADAIAELLTTADPDHAGAPPPTEGLAQQAPPSHYATTAAAIIEQRHKAGLFLGWDGVAKTPGLSPAALAVLQGKGYIGAYALMGVDNVGPQIGKELRRQGILAVFASLIGMLAYIGVRFELRFGIGAVMASIHDVLVTLGLFILMGFEFNLTTIAAFLTLIGYSVNDTVVIFDRMRENMRKNRRTPLIQVMNDSINQTLSRTIMTSGLTMLTVAALLALGGEVLRGFAFVMTVGIIVGTYSSVYVASPFALLWEQFFGAKSRIRGGDVQSGPASRPAGGGAATTPPTAAPRPAQAGGGAAARSPRAAAGPRRSGRR
jgi:preprotein translocase subunit SecF